MLKIPRKTQSNQVQIKIEYEETQGAELGDLKFHSMSGVIRRPKVTLDSSVSGYSVVGDDIAVLRCTDAKAKALLEDSKLEAVAIELTDTAKQLIPTEKHPIKGADGIIKQTEEIKP